MTGIVYNSQVFVYILDGVCLCVFLNISFLEFFL